MTEIDSSSEILQRLVALVTENGLAELTVEKDGLVVTVKVDLLPSSGGTSMIASPHALTVVQTPPYSQTTQGTPGSSKAVPQTFSRPATLVAIESPMVGVFYRSPSPEDPPFVHVGETLQIGQTIGLIEAMKVYSEIPSEIAGVIIEIPAQDGKLVQQGQALLYVEPL